MKKFNTIVVILTLLINTAFNYSFAKSKTKKVKSATAGKIYIPKNINGFKLSDTIKYKEIEFGLGFTYKNKKHPQVKFDYYIYPMYNNVSIEGMMIAEYEININGIKEFSEKDGTIVSTLHEELMSVNEHEFIKATINIDGNYGTYISELYLTSIWGHYVKARISYPMYDSKKFNLRQLAEDSFKQILIETEFKSKKPIEFSIVLDPAEFESENKNNITGALLFAATIQARSRKNLIYSFEDYYHIYNRLIAITEGPGGESLRVKNDETLDYFDVNDAGFLKEFVWSMFNRPYWTEPNDLNLASFQAWLRLNKSKPFIIRPSGVNILIN